MFLGRNKEVWLINMKIVILYSNQLRIFSTEGNNGMKKQPSDLDHVFRNSKSDKMTVISKEEILSSSLSKKPKPLVRPMAKDLSRRFSKCLMKKFNIIRQYKNTIKITMR